MKHGIIENGNSELLIYESKDGNIKLDVNLESETVWLSLEQMTKLFGRDKSVISRHIKNIFEEGELEKNSLTIANFATVQKEGTREVERNIDYYNLDVVISVGYRVKSLEDVRFRKWATARIKELNPIEKEYLKSINKINEIADKLNKINYA